MLCSPDTDHVRVEVFIVNSNRALDQRAHEYEATTRTVVSSSTARYVGRACRQNPQCTQASSPRRARTSGALSESAVMDYKVARTLSGTRHPWSMSPGLRMCAGSNARRTLRVSSLDAVLDPTAPHNLAGRRSATGGAPRGDASASWLLSMARARAAGSGLGIRTRTIPRSDRCVHERLGKGSTEPSGMGPRATDLRRQLGPSQDGHLLRFHRLASAEPGSRPPCRSMSHHPAWPVQRVRKPHARRYRRAEPGAPPGRSQAAPIARPTWG